MRPPNDPHKRVFIIARATSVVSPLPETTAVPKCGSGKGTGSKGSISFADLCYLNVLIGCQIYLLVVFNKTLQALSHQRLNDAVVKKSTLTHNVGSSTLSTGENCACLVLMRYYRSHCFPSNMTALRSGSHILLKFCSFLFMTESQLFLAMLIVSL